MMTQSQLLRGIVMVAFVLLTLLSMASFGILGGILPLIVIGGCMLIGRPRMLLFLFWGWAVSGELIAYLARNPLFDNLAIIVDVGLLGVLVATSILQRKVLLDATPVARVALGLIGLTFLSFLANRPPIGGALHFGIAYFRFLIVFAYMRMFLQPSDARLCYFVMIGSLVLQVVPNMGWLLRINPLPNYVINTTDYAIGTVQSCSAVSYLCIACICVMLCATMSPLLPRRRRILSAVVLFVAIVQIVLTFTIHACMIAAFCCGLFAVMSGVSRRTKFLVLLATVIAIAGFMQLRNRVARQEESQGVWGQLSSENLRTRWFRMLNGVKGRAYRDVLLYSHRDMPYFVLGAGPGNFGSAMGRKQARPLAERYFNYIFRATSEQMRQITAGGSITGIPYSGALAIWTELGPVGYLLYWGLHVYAMLRFRRFVKRKAYTDPFRHVLAEGFVLTMPAWLILNFLSDFCYVRFLHGGLWIWAAVIWDPDEPRHDEDGGSARRDLGPERASVPAVH